MPLTRKATLLAITTIATLAFTAGNASAAPVEVIEESGAACNPCDFHAAGSSQLIAHVALFGEVVVMACNDEFEGEINHLPDGQGVIGHVNYSNNHAQNPGQCSRVNCAEGQEREWPLYNAEETGPNQGTLDMGLCVRSEGGNDDHCDLTLELEEATADQHDYVLSATQNHECIASSGNHIEYVATWPLETDNHDAIEIVHL